MFYPEVILGCCSPGWLSKGRMVGASTSIYEFDSSERPSCYKTIWTPFIDTKYIHYSKWVDQRLARLLEVICKLVTIDSNAVNPVIIWS